MNQLLYVTARDGTRIAIDVYLPSLEPQQRVPTAFQTTRYHRSRADFSPFIGMGWIPLRLEMLGCRVSRVSEFIERVRDDP